MEPLAKSESPMKAAGRIRLLGYYVCGLAIYQLGMTAGPL